MKKERLSISINSKIFKLISSKTLLFVLVFFLLVQISSAADPYKDYLHQAAVPEHPGVKLFGQYKTSLFPGAATYSYPIEVPPGTNGLQPSLLLMTVWVTGIIC